MAEVVSCWQLTAQAGVLIDLTPVYAGFVMERVTMGQFLPECFSFSLSVLCHQRSLLIRHSLTLFSLSY